MEGSKGGADSDDTMDTDSPTLPAHKLGGEPQIKKSYHDIRITNQVYNSSHFPVSAQGVSRNIGGP